MLIYSDFRFHHWQLHYKYTNTYVCICVWVYENDPECSIYVIADFKQKKAIEYDSRNAIISIRWFEKAMLSCQRPEVD